MRAETYESPKSQDLLTLCKSRGRLRIDDEKQNSRNEHQDVSERTRGVRCQTGGSRARGNCSLGSRIARGTTGSALDHFSFV